MSLNEGLEKAVACMKATIISEEKLTNARWI